MKILFINAINPLIEVETRYPNLGLGYLASALQKQFGKDTFRIKVADKHIKDVIIKFKPDILLLTSVTQNFDIARQYATFAKNLNIPVVIGGVHISILPHNLSKEFDVGCIGEGEKTIVELISIFRNRGRFIKEDLSLVKGIVYKDNQEVIVNALREPLINMDEISFPARDLLKIGRHTYAFSSRGCPYDCIFCASTKFWHRVRFFSADYVVREIEELVEEYGVKLISFFDDLFIADISRLKKIVGILESKKFLKDLRFTCSARANLVNEEIAKLLKRMRVFSVGMGLESGSDKTLKYLKGGAISVEDNIRAVKILNKYRISPNASFVIGSPEETKEDMLKTYFFIKNNPIALFDTYVLTPFPGTPVWEYAKARSLVSDDMDWSRLNVNFSSNSEKAIILSEVLDRKAIIEMYKKFQILRLAKNFKNVWFTPQIFDLPKIALKVAKELFFKFLNRETIIY